MPPTWLPTPLYRIEKLDEGVLRDTLTRAASTGGSVLLQPGRLTVEPFTPPDNVWLDGGGPDAVLVRAPHTNGPLIRNGLGVSRLSIDGASADVRDWNCSEIELGQKHQELRMVTITNFAGLGIDIGGIGAKLHNCTLEGVSGGGQGPSLSFMGIHASAQSRNAMIIGLTVHGCAANGVFFDGSGHRLLMSFLWDNHLAETEFAPGQFCGGGQIDLSGQSSDCLLDFCAVSGSHGELASGIEVDGVGHTISHSVVRDQPQLGIILQQGSGHRVHSSECMANRVGLLINPEVRDTVLTGQNNLHDNRDANMEDHGQNTRYE